jgi:hypothetical protein
MLPARHNPAAYGTIWGGRATWLVNYVKRFRVGPQVGTSITAATTHLLINRRVDKSQQTIAWSLISCPEPVMPSSTIRLVLNLDIDLTKFPMLTGSLPKRPDPSNLWTIRIAATITWRPL